MHQKKIKGYLPRYPKKFLKGAAVTAAAAIALGTASGCGIFPVTTGGVAMPVETEEPLVLDGEVAIDEPTEEPEITETPMTTGLLLTPEPTEEPRLQGEPAVDESEIDPEAESGRDNGPDLLGKIVVQDDEP